MRARARLAALALAGAAVAALATVADTSEPSTAWAAAPRERRVAVFTDSVGLGAKWALPAAFGPGWDVHVDGAPARFVEQMEANFIRPRLATNPEWFGDHVVLGVAYNSPYWDWGRLDRSIDSIIATLVGAGVKHVHWVTLREVKPEYISAAAWRQIQPYYWYFPTVNQHLEAALARHPQLTLVDWAAVADQPGLTYDAIHLNNAGAALYSAIVRDSVIESATRIPDRGSATVAVPGGAGAAAAIVNLTVTAPRTAGFLDAAASGCASTGVSVHNYVRAEVAAHSAIVPLAPDGSFCVGTWAAVNLIADVSGTFPAGQGFTGFTPQRWTDTRETRRRLPAGGTLALDVADLRLPAGTPADAVAGLALSVTAVGAEAPGFLRVIACGTESATSNVNYVTPAPVPNLVIAAPGGDGTVCVHSSAGTDVVVDAFGVFTAEAGLVDVSERRFDSRDRGTPVAAGSVTTIDVSDLAGGDDGVVLNVTSVGARAPGFYTAYPCAAGRPETSTLNYADARPVSNATIVAPDAEGRICVYSHATSELIVDVQATIGNAFEGRRPVRLLDTRTG